MAGSRDYYCHMNSMDYTLNFHVRNCPNSWNQSVRGEGQSNRNQSLYKASLPLRKREVLELAGSDKYGRTRLKMESMAGPSYTPAYQIEGPAGCNFKYLGVGKISDEPSRKRIDCCLHLLLAPHAAHNLCSFPRQFLLVKFG